MNLDVHVYTPETLAAAWGAPWTASIIREACRRGHIPARQMGRRWIIPTAELAVWLAEHGPKPASKPESKPTLKPYTVKVCEPKGKVIAALPSGLSAYHTGSIEGAVNLSGGER